MRDCLFHVKTALEENQSAKKIGPRTRRDSGQQANAWKFEKWFTSHGKEGRNLFQHNSCQQGTECKRPRLQGLPGEALSGRLQIHYRTLTFPLKLIPGRTAYHVILMKRSQMVYYTTFVLELTSVSPETVTARFMKTISQQQKTPRRWRKN